MKKLSIAIVVPTFPNIVQPYIKNQIASLLHSKVDVTVIAKKRDTNRNTSATSGQHKHEIETIYINPKNSNMLVNLVTLPLHNKNFRSVAIKILRAYAWKKNGIKQLIKTLIYAKALSNKQYDLIHSHSLFGSYDYLFLRQCFSIPLVTTYHGVLPPGIKRLESHKMHSIFKHGDIFLVNTKSAQTDLHKLGCPQKKIHILPQGINLKKFPYKDHYLHLKERLILLSVGRLSYEKGHHTAIRALSLLLKQHPTLEYHIIGDGPQRAALTELANELGISQKIILHGFKSPVEISHLYANAQILVHPSLEETQGMVIQEAQSSGLPVIASNAGGIPEVITTNKTGLLFTKENYHQLARMIDTLLNDTALYKSLSQAARVDVEKRFDVNAICKQQLSLYHLLSDSP